jgi:hypothetical protein
VAEDVGPPSTAYPLDGWHEVQNSGGRVEETTSTLAAGLVAENVAADALGVVAAHVHSSAYPRVGNRRGEVSVSKSAYYSQSSA